MTGAAVRVDRGMFGGSALAVTVACFEQATEQDVAWACTQFVAPVRADDAISCRTEVLAAGRRASQVRVEARRDGDLVYTGLGSTVSARPEAIAERYEWLPSVLDPRTAAPVEHVLPPDLVEAHGPLRACELRWAARPDRPGLVWARMSGEPVTRPVLAFVGDFVPDRALRAIGSESYVTSLDNAIRFGAPPGPADEWILVDVDAPVVHGGIVHTSARLWSEDGRVLAVVNQTATLRAIPDALRSPSSEPG